MLTNMSLRLVIVGMENQIKVETYTDNRIVNENFNISIHQSTFASKAMMLIELLRPAFQPL